MTNPHTELIVLHCEIQHSTFQIRLQQGTKEDQSLSLTGHELSKNPTF